MNSHQYAKTDVLLNAKNINLSFGDKTILKDVNFHVNDIIRPDCITGQIVSLVGRSGTGKTQMIRMLAGLSINGAVLGDKPRKDMVLTGEILINKVPKPVTAGDMGIVFQDYYMPDHLTINKMFMKAAKKNPIFKDEKEMQAYINDYVNAFELHDHINKYPGQLSGGQKQRASIVTQLVNGSNFLLMDEPFSGLDPLMIDKTTDLLMKVAATDELKTIIIVSHDLENCIAISDTVFVLSKKGREEKDGATIVSTIDLIERDLTWHSDVKRLSVFHDTIEEVKSLL